MLERSITSAITDYLDLIGAWWFKVHGHGMQRRGITDIIACYKGRLYGIEVKVPKGKVSMEQQAEIDAINAASGVAFVARDVSDVMERMPR